MRHPQKSSFNVRIYCFIRRHQLQMHVQQQAVQSSDAGNNLNLTRLKRSAMNTFVFFIVLIICYLPLYVVLTVYGLSIKDGQSEQQFAITAVFMNSSITSILYCWRLRKLRTAIVKTARQMLCKQTEENQTTFFLNEKQCEMFTVRKHSPFFLESVFALQSILLQGMINERDINDISMTL